MADHLSGRSADHTSSPKSGTKSNTTSGSASDERNSQALEANLSTLVLSIGSSAAMALGLAPNPMTGKVEKDLNLARFNIDLLQMLFEKTKGNLTHDEQKFLESILTDLQMKYVQAK
jgi:hypothetical protein